MEELDDKIVEDFLSSHRTEINDKGFSERVLLHLPQRKSYWFITPLFVLLGLAFISFLVDYKQLISEWTLFIEETPLIYLIGFYYLFFAIVITVLYKTGRVRGYI